MARSVRPVLRTGLCDRFRIEYPIIQAPMAGVGGPQLVAAVGRAGGMGILAGAFLTPGELRDAIREIRDGTDQPFGANLLLAADLRPPVPAELIPSPVVDAVQETLNPLRAALGLEAVTGPPSPPPDDISAKVEVILDERVPVFSVGLGDPGPELVEECHRREMLVVAMVTTAEDARIVEGSGVDAVVAQGVEAGGHRSHFHKPPGPERGGIGGLALIPDVVDAVRIPVIAAGGIADGRGLVAALALGASGVFMGTRFVATQESIAPRVYKEAVVERPADSTTVTDVFSGRYARALRNDFTQRYADSGAPVLPFFWQLRAAADVYRAAVAAGDTEHFPMWAGHSVGLVHDLPTAEEVVRRTVQEARRLLVEMSKKIET